MMEYVYAALILIGVILAVYGLDQLGLWMERRGWLYYRKSEPKGSAMVGNALHELNSIFDSSIKSEEEIREELQMEEQKSGDDIDEDIKAMIQGVQEEKNKSSE